MRIGLIAAVTRTAAGGLRGELPLAGRSVLGWQVDVLRMLGADRVLCLTDTASGDVLQLQHEIEASGAAFHALQGFAAVPALVRAEDELIVLRDGLVPDPALIKALLGSGEQLLRVVAAIPADHPLAAARQHDFERIDAGRHWAGVLVMRGAAVQQLADFAPDADPVSVLLRLALQAGTPYRDLTPQEFAPEGWLLADSARAVALHEKAMLAKAAPQGDWRAPVVSLARLAVRTVAPRGLRQGAMVAGAFGGALMLAGLVLAMMGWPALALALAGGGAFFARVAAEFDALSARLRPGVARPFGTAVWGIAVDLAAGATLWFALAPLPTWIPLAVCGPLLIGLARLAERHRKAAIGAIAGDRAAILLVLALAATAAVFAEALACLALGLLAGLLLHSEPD